MVRERNMKTWEKKNDSGRHKSYHIINYIKCKWNEHEKTKQLLAECHADKKQNGGWQGLWEEKGNGELVFHGYRISSGGNEKGPEMNMLMVAQQCDCA